MSDEAVVLLKRIADSTDLMAKLVLEAVRGERSQKEMILYLDSAGLSAGRIAELLGTTLQTVYPTLSRERTKKSSRKQ